MVFSSTEFLTLFLPLITLFYFIFPVKLRNGLLLAFSLVFYAWGEPVYVTIMLASIGMNYLFGLGIDRFRSREKTKKALLAVSVVCNLSMLGVFKYADFVIDNLNLLPGVSLPAAGIALPIGISFFTFQAMSYVIDVYRATAPVQKNILNFGLYISLFPQLIAGPIVRYSTVAEQIAHRRTDFDLAAQGIRRFITGLAKKVLIANNVGFLWARISAADAPPAADAWLGAIAFAFQIYFDFSGYSDMAIGLGRIFGFRFLENFDYPYISRSVTEFWRRWHISLGTWFREYLYIPLGGNRRGAAKQVRNILIVWLLTGLWHGASWNFVLWGLYYGVLLLLEKFVVGKILNRAPAAVGRICTLLAVLFGWVLFALDDTGALFSYFGAMFGANGGFGSETAYLLTTNAPTLLIAAFASLPFGARFGKMLSGRAESATRRKRVLFFAAETVWYGLLFLLSTAYLVDSTYNPFIYFRF
ncbi:MAG: MBOAT family protein [Clostridia bacterium]|nr:MBOAT family protein [Clostridia bacterium]